MDKEIKIMGKNLYIKKLREFIRKAAVSDANVLLLGETGVAKN